MEKGKRNSKWKQREKINEMIDEDSNTKYFHAKANGRRRKNKIIVLDQEDGRVEGEKNLIDYITNF